MKEHKPKKSKYKSDIIKKRKRRLFGEIEKALDELEPALVLDNKKMNEVVQEIIKTSPVFGEINHLCTQVINLYGNLKLDTIDFDSKEEKLLYSCLSNTKWSEVKDFYTNWFVKHQWQFIEESGDNRFPDKIAVKVEDYKITLYDSSAFDCYILCGEKK